MKLEALLFAFVISIGIGGLAKADLRGRAEARPIFTNAETRTIERNEILNAIVDQDPWLVRDILDYITSGVGRGPRASVNNAEGFDTSHNPDLAETMRTAEGTAEWLDLVKRAKAEKEAREREALSVGNRSSEGSLELIEMMRRARETKGVGPSK